MMNTYKHQGYTSAPLITLKGGEGDTRFVPAQVYAQAPDSNKPDDLVFSFRTVCEADPGVGAEDDTCPCYPAMGAWYSSEPTISLSGGVSDYIELSETETAATAVTQAVTRGVPSRLVR